MSGQAEKSEGEGSQNGVTVGYCRPPVEHRFKKGQSGNPRGRPKRKAEPKAKFDPSTQPTERLILEEAYRTVTIREGDKTIELPAVQAAMRSLAIAAMKGSRLSQKAFAEIVRAAEKRERSETIESMEAAIEYKRRWTDELERLRKLGLPEPELIPHPDDMDVDLRNGGVIITGPMTSEEKIAHDKRVSRRDEAQSEVTEYARLYRAARDAKKKEIWLEGWHSEQLIFDIINDGLKGRYKCELADRSHRPGASKAGQGADHLRALKRQRPD